MLINFIPRPVRDLIGCPLEIRARHVAAHDTKSGIVKHEINEILDKPVFVRPLAEKMLKAAYRTVVAALGALAVYQLSVGSLGVAAGIGALVSLPAVAIAGGSFLAYQGATAAISALATGSFQTLGLGLAALFGGWLALEHHDMIPIGLAEPLFTKLSDSHADGIVRDIDRLPVRA